MSSTGRLLFVADRRKGRGPGALDDAFDVVVAEGAIDAAKWLSSATAPPDCVVTGADPPDLGLDAFLNRVRRTVPDTPTVVVGPLPWNRDAASALVHADDYVPQEREEVLVERVRRVVQDSRVDRAVDRHGTLARRIADVAVAVAGAADREAVESAVYRELAAGDLYSQVWIARVGNDGDIDSALPTSGPVGEADLADLAPGEDPSFVSRSLERGQVVSSDERAPVRGASASAPVEQSRGAPGSDALASAAVPFFHDGRVHGLALVTARRADAFDTSERGRLADLGAVVGHALAALREGPEPETAEYGRGMETLVHELRNPLGIAQSHLELFMEDQEPESLERVESALERMVETIDRVYAGVGRQESAEAEPLDLETLAEDAWSALPESAGTLEVEQSATVRADRDMAVRLLANLFQNAVQHGGGAVTVRVGALPDGFFVADDGPGIPPDEREAVFERGYTTADDGLGVGLSIVRSVADAHRWTVAITAADDGGARFEVTDVELAERDAAEEETV